MTEITKKALTDLIKKINEDIDKLKNDLLLKNEQIEDLKTQNEQLKESNTSTLVQIKEYIKELEKIRNHYVDNHNNSK